jgi:hypothetical protein
VSANAICGPAKNRKTYMHIHTKFQGYQCSIRVKGHLSFVFWWGVCESNSLACLSSPLLTFGPLCKAISFGILGSIPGAQIGTLTRLGELINGGGESRARGYRSASKCPHHDMHVHGVLQANISNLTPNLQEWITISTMRGIRQKVQRQGVGWLCMR